jgi:NDP-sugar pyrophosphorylase family protein
VESFNLIIPCAGVGQRFIEAGYTKYKPLIPLKDKAMIISVIQAFDKDTKVYIITDINHHKLLESELKEVCDINFIIIDPHKLGPAYSILQASEKLPKSESCFVAYNDVKWHWNFKEVKDFIKSNTPDGIIFNHYGFHPHLIKNNFSAFCKVDDTKITAIKEKGSFTENWMNEWLSVGVYYYKSTKNLIENINKLVINDEKAAGEYYPSKVYNYMLSDNLCILNYSVTDFVHAGTPEQYEDAEEWDKILKSKNKTHDIPTLIMMCGTGERMKELSPINKAGIKIKNQYLFEFITAKIASKNNAYLVNHNTLSLVKNKKSVINIGEQTSTQAENLLKALPKLSQYRNLLVSSNDCYGITDFSLLEKYKNFDLVLFGFRFRLIHKKQAGAHSSFFYKNNNVTEVYIKQSQKGNLGFAGMYYFPDINIIDKISAYDYVRNGSIDDFAVFLLNNNYKVSFIELKHYVHLGTPEEFLEYKYWQSFYNSHRKN